MNKHAPHIVLTMIFTVNFMFGGIGNSSCYNKQPPLRESKTMEHSLRSFFKKIVSKDKVVNFQYKRCDNKAVVCFDILRKNETLFMMYLLEYREGDWKIRSEYRYVKTVNITSADVC